MRRRTGFTIVEVLIALTVTLLAVGIAIPFYLAQSHAVTTSARRLDAQLNVAFGIAGIDRDLRVAGVGVVATQPMIVHAATDAIVFNVDLQSRTLGDLGAVYVDPDLPLDATTLLAPTNAITLPHSAWTYPDSTYWQSPGVPGAAETISYWVEPDTVIAGRMQLMRRVNDLPPRIAARGIVPVAGEPYFRYFRNDSAGVLREVSPASLPARHLPGWHGTAADTGASAVVDDIRLVRVAFTAVHRDDRGAPVPRQYAQTIRIANAGLLRAHMCGDAPLPPPSVSAALNGAGQVVLSWGPSLDEGSGESDIDRYVIYRRLAGGPAFREPLTVVSGGLASYAFTDATVASGSMYVYGVAAQDCTPSASTVVSTSPISIP